MLRTQSNPATGLGGSRPFVLLAVLPALLLVAALAPASALAGTSGGDGPCSASLTATQDPAVASFTVDCGDGNNIVNVNLRSSEDGRTEGGTGTTCTENSARDFDCSPDDPDFIITGRFDGDSGDICASPRLNVDFEIDLEDGSTQNIDNVETANCSDDSGGGGDEDSGATPEGGVDSGTADTSNQASPGPALSIVGAALAVLALASAGMLVRRIRTNP